MLHVLLRVEGTKLTRNTNHDIMLHVLLSVCEL